MRFSSPSFEKLYERALGYFMREQERGEKFRKGGGEEDDDALLLTRFLGGTAPIDQVNGVNYYLLGIVIVLTFFPRGEWVRSCVGRSRRADNGSLLFSSFKQISRVFQLSF